jgi:YHS domain-containing protein
MSGIVLRIILFLIVARLIWKFVRGVLEGAGYFQTSSSHPSVGLVRDPVCGVFVVPSNALTLGSGLETRYFCSEKCRTEWRRSRA